MYEELSIDRLIKRIKEAASKFPDFRTGNVPFAYFLTRF